MTPTIMTAHVQAACAITGTLVLSITVALTLHAAPQLCEAEPTRWTALAATAGAALATLGAGCALIHARTREPPASAVHHH